MTFLNTRILCLLVAQTNAAVLLAQEKCAYWHNAKRQFVITDAEQAKGLKRFERSAADLTLLISEMPCERRKEAADKSHRLLKIMPESDKVMTESSNLMTRRGKTFSRSGHPLIVDGGVSALEFQCNKTESGELEPIEGTSSKNGIPCRWIDFTSGDLGSTRPFIVATKDLLEPTTVSKLKREIKAGENVLVKVLSIQNYAIYEEVTVSRRIEKCLASTSGGLFGQKGNGYDPMDFYYVPSKAWERFPTRAKKGDRVLARPAGKNLTEWIQARFEGTSSKDSYRVSFQYPGESISGVVSRNEISPMPKGVSNAIADSDQIKKGDPLFVTSLNGELTSYSKGDAEFRPCFEMALYGSGQSSARFEGNEFYEIAGVRN